MNPRDPLELTLYQELCAIPLIDPHSHVDPRQPAAKTLDDLLGYHYYTELAHSAGLAKARLAELPPRLRCQTLLQFAERFDNTIQYAWLVELAQVFLNFQGEQIKAADGDRLWQLAEMRFGQAEWEDHVLTKSRVEKVFLTNDFDDPLTGFDNLRYVPCLRTDDLVFHFEKPEVRARLAKATGIEVGEVADLRRAIRKLFEHFVGKGAKACAISLPPWFTPTAVSDATLSTAIKPGAPYDLDRLREQGVFWMLAEHCREFKLPFDLMVGVNRRVYREGVFQGQDLFDQRTSLIQYAELFNAFPEVTFPVSVLTSAQNQELASFSWIFPNVATCGHWWYSNVPGYIERDAQVRLQAVPKTKQIGYYSDAYKLEFILPKFNMYRRTLARILARDYVMDRGWSETQALALGRQILRDNVVTIFKL
jgi:glucuronate isomerase